MCSIATRTVREMTESEISAAGSLNFEQRNAILQFYGICTAEHTVMKD